MLDRPIEFSTKIVPICLWEGDNDIDRVVNEMGTVAGWGTDKCTTIYRVNQLI